MKTFLLLMAMSVLNAFAGDVTGTWKATAEGPNGTMERTFVFKADGSTLTGETTSSFFGTSTIDIHQAGADADADQARGERQTRADCQRV